MSHIPDHETTFREAFAPVRELQATEREVQNALRRIRRKPRRGLFGVRMAVGGTGSGGALLFGRKRLLIAGPVMAALVIAAVLAMDLGNLGSNDGSFIAKARAAAVATKDSIIESSGKMFMGMTVTEKGKKPKSVSSEKNFIAFDQWQLGTGMKGKSRMIMRDPKGKAFMEGVINNGHSTYYTPAGNLYTKFKGLDLLGDNEETKRLEKEFAIYNQLSTNPAAFYEEALNGKSEVKVIGDKTINGRAAKELLIPAPKSEEGMQARATIALDAETYKPLEANISMAMDIAEADVKIEVTARMTFERFDPKAVTSAGNLKKLELTLPRNAKKVSTDKFLGKVMQPMMDALLDKEAMAKAFNVKMDTVDDSFEAASKETAAKSSRK